MSIQKGIEKIYAVSSWIKVIQGFQSKRPELPVFLVAGPEDDEVLQEFRRLMPDFKVTAPFQLSQLAGLITGSALLLCTDSAPMHIGVATQTPLIALFGPTDPASDKKVNAITPEQILQEIFPE